MGIFLDEVKKAISVTKIEMNNGVKSLIQNNLEQGLQFDGAKVKRLSKGWIKRKGHSTPFLYKGTLRKSLRDKQIKDGYEINVSSGRNKIAGFLQKDRPFFGFTKAKGEKIIDNSIKVGFNKF